MWVRAFGRAAVVSFAIAAVAGGPGCSVDAAPGGVKRTVQTGGPSVVFDMAHKPLPEIPLPNDVATYPDPTSRTGRRINASLVAPTTIERNARTHFSKLEGWGTFAPISIPFSKPLDAEDVKKRHADDDFAFEDDVVYVVNLKTGVPVPLDVGGGNFPVTLRELSRYWPNDPRKGEPNLLFETVEEDVNGNGILDPGEDSDFDGVLDHPNFPGGQRSANGVDGLYTFYEAETHSLVLRPMLPLDEMTEYAVVVTDRLHGVDKGDDGEPRAVQSPFEYVHHPAQEAAVRRAADVMAKKPEYYGLGANPLDHVQFVFTFTTQPTVSDMFALRDGAYGKGKFAWIGNSYPAEITLSKAVGKVEAEDADPAGWESNAACQEQGTGARFVAKITPSFMASLKDAVENVFGLKGPSATRLLQGYENVAYIAVGTVRVPWLLGDVKDVSPEALIDIDHQTGAIPHSDTEVPFFVVVPKTTEKHKPPFPVTYYGHGYTGNMTEGLGFAAELARHGVATIGMNAPGHGLELSQGEENLVRSLFGNACVQPFMKAFTKSRVRDLNKNGELAGESGRDYWTSYLFHTRDVVRQAALEEVMVTRALRRFDGVTRYDWNGDGVPDLAGDFDGDGTPDIGGPDARYYAWGGSLGGILSSLAAAVDPYVTATAPMAGGGALTDVGVRSFQGGVVEAVVLRTMGPLIVSVPAETRLDCKKKDGACQKDEAGNTIWAPKDQQTRTICDPGQKSVRWVVVDLNDDKEFEIACVDPAKFAEGYDVVVENRTNGELRCAKITKEKADSPGSADFRVSIPASAGDKIALAAYKPGPGKVQAVSSYGKVCDVQRDAELAGTIEKWSGLGVACDHGTGDCVQFQDREYPIGSDLTALSEGYGLRRQTPEFRKFLQLAQIALDPADPVSFAPYYYVKPRRDENGNVVPPAGIYTINTIGDMNVPVNTGIAAARIHGAIPFLRADNVAAKDYPDYVAPDALVDLFGMTPNKALLQNHVIEGIRWLARHPAGASCVQNERDFEGCGGAKPYSNPKTCQEALFDPDDLSDGTIPSAPQRAAVPLRLARLAKPATGADLASIWAPRLQAAKGGWTPNAVLGAVVNAFIVPEGVHGFDPPDPCKAFDTGAYLVNMVGRFFSTGAQDLHYLSNPTGHKCAAVTDWKSSDACRWE